MRPRSSRRSTGRKFTASATSPGRFSKRSSRRCMVAHRLGRLLLRLLPLRNPLSPQHRQRRSSRRGLRSRQLRRVSCPARPPLPVPLLRKQSPPPKSLSFPSPVRRPPLWLRRLARRAPVWSRLRRRLQLSPLVHRQARWLHGRPLLRLPHPPHPPIDRSQRRERWSPPDRPLRRRRRLP